VVIAGGPGLDDRWGRPGWLLLPFQDGSERGQLPPPAAPPPSRPRFSSTHLQEPAGVGKPPSAAPRCLLVSERGHRSHTVQGQGSQRCQRPGGTVQGSLCRWTTLLPLSACEPLSWAVRRERGSRNSGGSCFRVLKRRQVGPLAFSAMGVRVSCTGTGTGANCAPVERDVATVLVYVCGRGAQAEEAQPPLRAQHRKRGSCLSPVLAALGAQRLGRHPRFSSEIVTPRVLAVTLLGCGRPLCGCGSPAFSLHMMQVLVTGFHVALTFRQAAPTARFAQHG
jgi:hypothetical protein